MSIQPAIDIRDVSFAYGSTTVLEDVNLTVAQRETLCVVGPNGGGKTTLLKLILGLLQPNKGEIRVFGLPPRLARPKVGYMPQHVAHDQHFPITVEEVVLMGRLGGGGLAGALGWYTKADRAAAVEALRAVGMEAALRWPMAALSGGQRQRVLLARAICTQPELLLLDEPTANVDTLAEAQLFDLLGQLSRRMTILMVSHDLGFVTHLAEKVICVNRRVVVHPTGELTGQTIRQLYGGEVRLVDHQRNLVTSTGGSHG